MIASAASLHLLRRDVAKFLFGSKALFHSFFLRDSLGVPILLCLIPFLRRFAFFPGRVHSMTPPGGSMLELRLEALRFLPDGR